MVEKKLSATALSQHSPLRPTERTSAVGASEVGEVPARVLTAPVRMENDALLGCPVPEGHQQCVFDEFGAHVIGQRPADDASAGQVEDRRQVGPALPGRDVGDVADIAPVHLFARTEVALNEVTGQLGVRVGDGGLAPTLLAPALEAGLTHEPGHLALTAGHVTMEELFVDPRGAIGALGFGVNGADLLEQLGVGDLSLRRDAVAALVVGGLGDLEQTTRHALATLWPATFSASMKGSTFTGSPSRRKPSLA